MERPSFIATLKQAHRFTIQNFWSFVPLALKTVLSFLIICAGVIAVIIAISMLGGSINPSEDLVGQIPNLLNHPLILILGIVLIILFVGGIGLVLCPFYVSLFRRVLLDEEIDRTYLKRLFATRELNFFVAQLKIMGAFAGVLLASGALGLFLYGLTVFIKSEVITIIVAGVGIIEGIILVGLLCFLFARFAFVNPNAALDRGSNLKTSIQQTKGYTLFLLGITIFVNLVSEIFQGILKLSFGFIFPGDMGLMIAAVVSILISITLSYYVMLMVPAAIAYVYKTVVLKEEAEEQQVIAPL
jgi:hypothetical protein